MLLRLNPSCAWVANHDAASTTHRVLKIDHIWPLDGTGLTVSPYSRAAAVVQGGLKPSPTSSVESGRRLRASNDSSKLSERVDAV